MGRRRKRVVRIPKRTIPKVFTCLICGKNAVTVKISRSDRQALIHCGSCKAKGVLQNVTQSMAPVDVYSIWCDQFYKSRVTPT